jgi:hypothetical protein
MHGLFYLKELFESSPNPKKNTSENQRWRKAAYPGLDELPLSSVWLTTLSNTMPETMRQETETSLEAM